ncbi:hypothetical protein CVS40_0266 [Lucilia cuprina]|nr:hypothetical protein CVS40_0266 [Lucilia cuprina]
MMLIFLCCFFTLIQTGWSSNQYIFESTRGLGTLQTQQINPVYDIEYYFFSAPEDKIDQNEALRKLIPSIKGRQQVIFIKNPENNNYEKVLQNLLQNAVQPKTHIYVLNKEPNYAGLQKKFQTIQKTVHHKPEVHFIKYRNPTDAQRIQSTIIQKYGGRSNEKAALKQTRSVTSDNKPVDKNYAINFLPTGVDVVPGSSYIPLVLY